METAWVESPSFKYRCLYFYLHFEKGLLYWLHWYMVKVHDTLLILNGAWVVRENNKYCRAYGDYIRRVLDCQLDLLDYKSVTHLQPSLSQLQLTHNWVTTHSSILLLRCNQPTLMASLAITNSANCQTTSLSEICSLGSDRREALPWHCWVA
jgi:hypothetical protein